MSTPDHHSASLPRKPPVSGLSDTELEMRIGVLEERLAARQRKLAAHWQGLENRGKRLLQPRHLMIPLVGAAAGIAVLSLWRQGSARLLPSPSSIRAVPANPTTDLLAIAVPLLTWLIRRR